LGVHDFDDSEEEIEDAKEDELEGSRKRVGTVTYM
jgi:hypothetical protein